MHLKIDPSLCTGCLACQVYCSLYHEGAVSLELARVSVLRAADEADYLLLACVPCGEMPCLAACPVPGAIDFNATGAVVIDESLCTGCSKCARACRIGAIRLHRLPGRGARGKAVVLKCDLCAGEPRCVQVCSPQAISLAPEDEDAQAEYDRLRELRERWLAEEPVSFPVRQRP